MTAPPDKSPAQPSDKLDAAVLKIASVVVLGGEVGHVDDAHLLCGITRLAAVFARGEGEEAEPEDDGIAH